MSAAQVTPPFVNLKIGIKLFQGHNCIGCRLAFFKRLAHASSTGLVQPFGNIRISLQQAPRSRGGWGGGALYTISTNIKLYKFQTLRIKLPEKPLIILF